MKTCNILIVDDDAVDRKATQRALEQARWGGVIFQADSSLKALELMGRESIGCILLDYQLPGQDGLDLLKQWNINSDEIPPVVMLTGEGNEMVAVEAMKNGAFDYLPKTQLAPDVLCRVITQAVEKSRLQRLLAEAQAQLERQALYDMLTSMGNRNLFLRDLDRNIAVAQRQSHFFSLMLLDLDKFKAANDRFGHDAGDFILTEFGRRVLEQSRATDTFYRLGGDEFTALIAAHDVPVVLSIAERLKNAAITPFVFDGHAIEIGISIGIAIYPRDGNTADKLLKAADIAMYRAKHSGEGGVSDGMSGRA
ncbi:MAG: diguanylate cyclase [Betaproteobacteria bacterium]|nr:diguanylate cyclase [Betaproteobacteria bacterium]